MQYFGGKFKIARDLSAFLDSKLEENQSFVDLFAGSCNVVANITKTANRYANDINEDVMTTLEAASNGYEFPEEVSKEEYRRMRLYGSPSDPLYGFMAYGCSFAGKRWGGYAKSGTRNYALNAKNSIAKKGQRLVGVRFSVGSYQDFKLPANALVYCDIPYSDATKYSGKASEFNHEEFYSWVADQTCTVFISEYATGYNPLGLVIAWQKESKQDVRSKSGDQKKTAEVLFHKPAS